MACFNFIAILDDPRFKFSIGVRMCCSLITYTMLLCNEKRIANECSLHNVEGLANAY